MKKTDKIVIRIVYDNNPLNERLETAWGFACVIKGLPETILFDTGGKGELLLSNMTAMKIEPEQIDCIVLSHVHSDHIGGLGELLEAHGHVKVFMPKFFPSDLKREARQFGAKVIATEDPCQVCPGAWTTGVLKRRIQEQGLYLTTSRGLVVVTGCAHPGIVSMAEAARRHANQSIFAVIGGFHMSRAWAGKIHEVVEGLQNMGIEQVAPCHCSGDKTRRLMNKAFDRGYLAAGVGARLVFDKPR